MKIAIGTDDKKMIRLGHFGESRYYLIYEIENKNIQYEELRANPFTSEQEQHQHGQARKIIDFLSDCQLFMGKSMGGKSLKEIANNNIDVVTTTIVDAREAVTAYLNSEDEHFKYYNSQLGRFLANNERK